MTHISDYLLQQRGNSASVQASTCLFWTILNSTPTSPPFVNVVTLLCNEHVVGEKVCVMRCIGGVKEKYYTTQFAPPPPPLPCQSFHFIVIHVGKMD